MNKDSYENLMNILNDYKAIPNEIKRKQRILEIKLCDPTLHALKGFSAFVSMENEIEYLKRKYELLQKILASVNEQDRNLLNLIMNGKNVFVIESMLHMNYYTISKKVDYYSKVFTDEINYKKIYEVENEKQI